MALAQRREVKIGPATTETQRFLTAMVRVKNEARFLPEWIAHHLAVGVEHVFVYDNGSTDGTPQAIAPFRSAGLATLVNWPSRPISPGAELHALNVHGASTRWMAFLDADEFIREVSPGHLLDTLARLSNAPALALNWRYYGSSWHETVPDGLITSSFQYADRSLNEHIKVIAQPSKIRRIRNSHNFFYERGQLAKSVLGSPVLGSFSPTQGAEQAPLSIDHYVYRSRENYIEKTRMGYVDARGAVDRARRQSRIDSEFSRHNDITVGPATHVSRKVALLLRRLGYAAPYLIR